ncbi:MAG TPA: hypothetical protein VKM93_10955 [Terriglobia bacterium]|nr:hypothetical protein [Terriglobia bacterium]
MFTIIRHKVEDFTQQRRRIRKITQIVQDWDKEERESQDRRSSSSSFDF